ncbi:Alpha/Beta hydrolase protein, partial [Blyttiomyces helicus]
DFGVRVPSGSAIRGKAWGEQDGWRKGGPQCILAIHGWLDNCNSFELLGPRLAAAGAYVVAIDLAGHGVSEHRGKDGGYYLWDHIDDILGVVDEFAWKTFTLLGHSTGGHLATVFAGTYPDRVARLIALETLSSPMQFRSDEPHEVATFIRRRREMSTWGRTSRVYDSFEEAARARTNGFTKVSIEAARRLCERGLAPVLPAPDPCATEAIIQGELKYAWRTDPRLTLWAYLHCPEATLLKFFAAVKCPVVVVAGRRQGVEGERAAKRLATFEIRDKFVAEGGHYAHMEEKYVDGVADAIVRGW